MRGPLHGIPVLVKDNIATDDNMQTTAGSLALLRSHVPADAVISQQLREAGAVVLGKANFGEWANFRGLRRSLRSGARAAVLPAIHTCWISILAALVRDQQ